METTKKKSEQVVDGSDIMELVENKEVFSNFIDHKFQELDRDNDGHLSVKELQPAVADLGAALGLPPQGSSSDSDHIYSEVWFQVFILTHPHFEFWGFLVFGFVVCEFLCL